MRTFIIVGAFLETTTGQVSHSGICGALHAPLEDKETSVPFFGTITFGDNGAVFMGETYDCYGRAVISGMTKNDALSFEKVYGSHPDKISFHLTAEGNIYIGHFQAENAGQKSEGPAKCRLIPLEKDFFQL